MDISIFEQITSALTVKLLCSPLGPDIPAEYTFADLEMLVMDEGIDISGNASGLLLQMDTF
jgi:hypothetical protein